MLGVYGSLCLGGVFVFYGFWACLLLGFFPGDTLCIDHSGGSCGVCVVYVERILRVFWWFKTFVIGVCIVSFVLFWLCGFMCLVFCLLFYCRLLSFGFDFLGLVGVYV